MEKLEKKKEVEVGKPTQTKEQAEQQIRMTYLAVKGIEAQRQEIIKQANEQIDGLNAEEKKLIELNTIASKDIELYQAKNKTAPKG